ncbi:MAG: hypothetical protein LUC98_11470 [Lachnospiraceae bacterium]|nr:hypothetical protein [Lachnospiraceae bacterium]
MAAKKLNMVPLQELNLSDRYTFEPVCREVPECRLEDGAVRIFLNTRGENEDEVPAELVEFLHYVENTTDQEAQRSDSERIRRIHDRVKEVRQNEEVGVRYMQAWEEKCYEREEGREEERRELIRKFAQHMPIEKIAEILEMDVERVRELMSKTEADG